MNWSTFLSGLLGSAIPAFIGSLIMLHLKKQIDASQARLQSDLQKEVVRFTKWHEKRMLALEEIYQAFQLYLEFLRKALYSDRGGMCMDPMWKFRETIEKQMIYIDDGMAKKINQYQTDLLLFWNSAHERLSAKGESAREEIRHELDYKIPSYLLKLQEDICRSLDPNHPANEDTFRMMMFKGMHSKVHEAT